MAEGENDIDLDLELDSETNETQTDDSNETDNQEETITWEQAQERKKKAERLDKAEKKLVELKKQAKTAPKESNGEYVTKQDLEIERFIAKNPEMENYKDDIVKQLAKGNTLQEAKLLIENSDKTIINRSKTNSMNISSGEISSKTTYTKSEVADMPQSKYNEFKRLQEQGKAFMKG